MNLNIDSKFAFIVKILCVSVIGIAYRSLIDTAAAVSAVRPKWIKSEIIPWPRMNLTI